MHMCSQTPGESTLPLVLTPDNLQVIVVYVFLKFILRKSLIHTAIEMLKSPHIVFEPGVEPGFKEKRPSKEKKCTGELCNP